MVRICSAKTVALLGVALLEWGLIEVGVCGHGLHIFSTDPRPASPLAHRNLGYGNKRKQKLKLISVIKGQWIHWRKCPSNVVSNEMTSESSLGENAALS